MEEKATILIVDDEPAIRMGLAATIGRYGYSVITAENGIDGILKAKNALPDLIVSDIMMPVVSGVEMKQQLSTDPQLASVPFIFLTARTAAEDRITGIRSGADDYVTKPFVTEELIARIESVLRRVQVEQERGREQMKVVAQEEMDRLRREILQNFNHELRTPLGNVITSLELAVNKKFTTPEEQSEFIRIALSSMDRMEGVVSDIIVLSDIDSDDLNRARQTIDPERHILAPVRKRLKRYEAKKLNFVHEITLNGPIMAPRREFTQGLLHLLDNAFQYSPESGTVTLTIYSGSNGGILITVQDEGPGIPVKEREKVFERFYQIDQGDARQHEGLGVGLTVARVIFESLHGTVKIMDCPQGCRIQAALPDLQPEDISYG